MKKATAFLLVLSLVFLFASCKTAENEESTGINETSVNATDEEAVTITDDKIIASDYSLEIPEGFEVKADSISPLLENGQGTVQLNIMDKTSVVKDFEAYVTATYEAAEASGIVKSEIAEITLKNVEMKRFSMVMENDAGEALESYVYFLNINNKIFMITLTSKDGEIEDVASADKFVEEIDFQNYS